MRTKQKRNPYNPKNWEEKKDDNDLDGVFFQKSEAEFEGVRERCRGDGSTSDGGDKGQIHVRPFEPFGNTNVLAVLALLGRGEVIEDDRLPDPIKEHPADPDTCKHGELHGERERRLKADVRERVDRAPRDVVQQSQGDERRREQLRDRRKREKRSDR